jgi:hypothetical protein
MSEPRYRIVYRPSGRRSPWSLSWAQLLALLSDTRRAGLLDAIKSVELDER